MREAITLYFSLITLYAPCKLFNILICEEPIQVGVHHVSRKS
jgi:hypothetical protein